MYKDIEEEVLDHEFDDETYGEEVCYLYAQYLQPQRCLVCPEPNCPAYEGA